jgi:uncharacterized protein YlzI (FlbEa/FlbD family)
MSTVRRSDLPFVVLTYSDVRHSVNLLQVESIEEHPGGAEITFASGTTLVVDETIDDILRMLSRRRKP